MVYKDYKHGLYLLELFILWLKIPATMMLITTFQRPIETLFILCLFNWFAVITPPISTELTEPHVSNQVSSANIQVPVS